MIDRIIKEYYKKASTLTIQSIILEKTGERIDEHEIDIRANRLGMVNDDYPTNPGPLTETKAIEKAREDIINRQVKGGFINVGEGK